VPAEAGIKFGSFVLLRRLARGGMAEVFLAQQRGLEGFDRRVAVKRILPHLADSQDFVRMFLGEAKLAAQLSHPNIVHIYEFGKVAGDFFIAMEYVEGVHAGDLFQASGKQPLSPTLVARIGADAAAALHSAHELRGADGKSLGLVHRDVSPANIMISYDGIVKLCDFGIAKAAAVTDQLTSPGQVKGKYAYMSPEQTVAKPLDGRSDVFSLSIVLWELLAGKLIVPRGDAVVAMRMIRDGKIEALSAVAPHVPPALAKAIAWGLETKREDRATASELAQALEAFIKQSPEIATPMQLGSWVRTYIPRERTSEPSALAPGGPGTQLASLGTVVSPPTEASSSAHHAVTPDRDRARGKNLIGASLMAESSDADAGTGERSLDESFATRVISKPSRPAVEATTGKPVSAPSSPTMIAPPVRASQRKPTVTNTMSGTSEAFDPVDTATTIDKPFTPISNPSLSAVSPRPVHGADAPTQLATPMRGMPADAEHSDSTETVQLDRAKLEAMSRGPAPQPHPALPGGAAPPYGAASVNAPTAFVTPLSGPRIRVSEPLTPSGAMQPLPGPRPLSAMLTPRQERSPMPGVGQRTRSKRMRVATAIAALLGLVGLALISFLIALAASGHHAQAEAPRPAATTVVMSELDASAPPTDATPLAGDQPEARPVTGDPGEPGEPELKHKLAASGHPALQMGRLTARTTPYAEVYESGKKIGDTPFAEHEMSVGPHVLVFKNPLHPAMTRRVVINAGKLTKFNERLGD
jgi:serine/threonine protein kinase